MKNTFLYIAFSFVLLVGILHYIAITFYFYWDVSWYDSMMHFLGGVTIGLLALWITYRSGAFKHITPTLSHSILTSIAAVVVIGIGWEIFENLNGLTQSTEGYRLDVIHDLIADITGSIVAGIAGSRKELHE